MTGTSPTEAEQLLRDSVEVWNGDFSKLDVMAESVDVHHPALPDGEVHGRDAFESFVRELREGFPDLRLAVDDLLADDEVVMFEWTVTGTHEGEYQGIPPTGRDLELVGMGKVLVADGQVQESRSYYNRQETFEQLGLTEE